MANITKNTLIDLANKINEIEGRPTKPFTTGENNERKFAQGHLTIDVNEKRYNIVVTTSNGYKAVTSDNSTSKEMDKFLSGYLLGIRGNGFEATEEIADESPVSEGVTEVEIPIVEVSAESDTVAA